MKLIIIGVLIVGALAGSKNLINLKCNGNGHAELDQQFENAGSKLVVVEFYQTWCSQSQKIAPKVEELAREYSEKIVIVQVDCGKCKDLADEYNATGWPIFYMIKNKQKLDISIGSDENSLASMIKKYA